MEDIHAFGQIWENWEIDEKLGEGAYGTVWKAHHRELGVIHYSAVKHISIPKSADEYAILREEGIITSEDSAKVYYETVLKNLLDEINLMYTLRGNTHIVSYEDHRIIPKPDGIGYDLFLRMELLQSVSSLIKAGNINAGDVIRLGKDISEAISLLNRNNIIHRDIKPQNLFVNAGGNFKLGDYGTARVLERTATAMSQKGTYSYMPPEIYKGETADQTVDIYSLGIVMYRMMNGNRQPFLPADGPVNSADAEEAIMKRISGVPLPPPAFADPDLARVILKACAYRREDRYQTGEALYRALDHLCSSAQEESISLFSAGLTLNPHDSEKQTTGKPERKPGKEPQAEPVPDYPESKKRKAGLASRKKRRRWLVPAAILAGLLAVFFLWKPVSLLFSSSAPPFEAFEDPDPAHYEYVTAEGGLKITGYTGDQSRLIFPRTLNNVPIVSIGKKDLNSYKNLEAVVIPDGVKTIEHYTFNSEDVHLKRAQIPASVEKIGVAAFSHFSGEMVLDPGNPVYERKENCIMEKETGRLVVYLFDGRTDLHLPRDVRIIGDGAFSNADDLQSAVIPGTVETIEREAFTGCSNLQAVTVQEGVKLIESNAFWDNYSLEHVKILSSETVIEGGAFNGCYGKIEFSPDNPRYYTKDNCVIERDTGRLVVYSLDGRDEIHLPEDVRIIGPYVFIYSPFQIVIVPGTVEAIEDHAFWNCFGLISLTIQEGVKTIGRDTFGANRKLTEIEIPSSVETIGPGAFRECSFLQTVRIREGVSAIESTAFGNDPCLTRVEIPSSVVNISGSAFQGCDPSLVIAAPAGSFASLYAAAYGFVREDSSGTD